MEKVSGAITEVQVKIHNLENDREVECTVDDDALVDLAKVIESTDAYEGYYSAKFSIVDGVVVAVRQ